MPSLVGSKSLESSQLVAVSYGTVAVTADSVVDFTEESGTLLFTPSGGLTRTIVVSTVGDLLDEEDDETFEVQLSSVTNASLTDGIGLGTILDDDPLPNLSIVDCLR
mgnify:CR=1 FL=1